MPCDLRVPYFLTTERWELSEQENWWELEASRFDNHQHRRATTQRRMTRAMVITLLACWCCARSMESALAFSALNVRPRVRSAHEQPRCRHHYDRLRRNCNQQKQQRRDQSTALQGVGIEVQSALSHMDAYWQAFPYTAAAIVCGIKASAADMIAQSSETQLHTLSIDDGNAVMTSVETSARESNSGFMPKSSFLPQFDIGRNFAFVVYGVLYQGLAQEHILNHLYPVWFGSGTEASVVMVKVAFNLLIQTTFVALPIAYIIKALIARDPLSTALGKYIYDIREQGLLTKCFLLWTPVNCVIFSVVPEHWRVTATAMVSFFWLIGLSIISSTEEAAPVDVTATTAISSVALADGKVMEPSMAAVENPSWISRKPSSVYARMSSPIVSSDQRQPQKETSLRR